MNLLRLLPALIVLATGILPAASALAAPTVRIPAGIDAAPWDSLLKKYVNDRGLVTYTAANLAALTERAYRAWLDRDDLNRYDSNANTVAVSAIFKWFKDDFTGAGALPQVLAAFGPAASADFFRRGEFRVTYQDYHWGLNDAGGHGTAYAPGWFKRLF